MIDRFFGETRWLSNFWKANVMFEGEMYPSTEHAYQAAKTLDLVAREQFRVATKSGDAKRAGRTVALREDWERIKFDVMLEVVSQKFFNHYELGDKLLATGKQKLVEGNHWHDQYWGDCTCPRCENTPGHNNLGKILMLVRAELRAARYAARLEVSGIKP